VKLKAVLCFISRRAECREFSRGVEFGINFSIDVSITERGGIASVRGKVTFSREEMVRWT
jgi:hypothetical protein